MKNLSIIFCFLFSFSLYSQEKSSNYSTAKQLLEQTIQHLIDEDYAQLHQLFDERMAEKLTPEKMQKTFSGFAKQYGKIEKGLEFSEQIKAEGVHYQQGIQLEKEKMNLEITLNEEKKLSSLLLKPHTPVYEWRLPPYADLSSFTEEEVKIGDTLPLLGKFTKAQDDGTITVVLVHGSGPNDMDETFGPNKFFKDLAFGLAGQGINSVRYNKRSFDYPSEMTRRLTALTIDEIVVDDAVAAIQFARAKGAGKVILIGHSLGGHMSAKIAERVAVDGVVVMAGNVSPLEELLVPQFEHIMTHDSETKINDFQLNMIKAQVKKLQDNDYDEKTAPPLLPLSLPASFWLSLKDYNPAKLAKKQTQPYLILNGERDYQVTVEQAKKWKNGNKNKHSKTILYPKLNHLFFAGEGVCIPSEYDQVAHINEKVINDIINWIKAV